MRQRTSALRHRGRSSEDESQRLEEMRSGDWVLPHALATGARPRWTLVGTVDSAWPAAVDPRGLVTPFGPGSRWSLDWWIGADDRWHLPSSDAGVRQHLLGGAPVVETLVRIPGGDAVQRTYGIRGEAFAGGDEWVVVEVENRSSVPFALAFAIRPATPERLTDLGSIAMVPVAGGHGRDPAQAVAIDGRVGLILPRQPARIAGSTDVGGDVAAIVQAGEASHLSGREPWSGVTCDAGAAQAAFVFPVAHTATIRVAIPLGAAPGSSPAWPPVIPPADAVVTGWDSHADRAMRMVVPDPQLSAAVTAAGRSVLLAPWSKGARHAGPRVGRAGTAGDGAALADSAAIIAALDRAGHHDDAAHTLRAWPFLLSGRSGSAGRARLLGGRRRSLSVDVAILDAIATHRLLSDDDALFEELLPDAVAAVTRLDRATVREALDPVIRPAAVRSLAAMVAALRVADQNDGASEVMAIASRLTGDVAVGSVLRPVGARALLATATTATMAGQQAGVALLTEALSEASPTLAFADHDEPQDLVASALLMDAARALLVHEVADGLVLIPVLPARWYGGPIELHDAPTAHGVLSYAIRWHGTRPALLWQLERRDGGHPVRLTVPGLDPDWSSHEASGDALLAIVVPPSGLDPVTLVTEHPADELAGSEDAGPEHRGTERTATERAATARAGTERVTSDHPDEGGSFV